MNSNEKTFSFFRFFKKLSCCGNSSIAKEKKLESFAIKEEKKKSLTQKPPYENNTTTHDVTYKNNIEISNKFAEDKKTCNQDNLNNIADISKTTPPTPFNSPNINYVNLADSIQLNNSFAAIQQNGYQNNADNAHNGSLNNLNTNEAISSPASLVSHNSQNTSISSFLLFSADDDFVEINQPNIEDDTISYSV